MKDISLMILAAGKGTRMGKPLPKVLIQLDGETLIENLLKSIKQTEYSNSVSIVIGFQGEKVIDRLGNKSPHLKQGSGDKYNFIWQKEQLGTGHAVQQCEESLKGKYDSHLILYGDVPFISPKTIQGIIDLHKENSSVLAMVTLKLPDFDDMHNVYYHFGRIIRDKDNEIIKIVEFKDTTEQERNITEVNPAIYCVDDSWLWENLNKIKNYNHQNEYYLTDLVDLAHQQGIKVNSLIVNDGFELMGVNTKDELEVAKDLYFKNRK